MDNEEKFVNELEKLYDAWDEELIEESLESFPLYANLKPEPNRYSAEQPIAQGGMKKISKVFDPKVGRSVAMAGLYEDAPKELYEPFLREAYLTSQLDHPNIITIFDIFLDEDLRPHFTMELKTGQTFKDLIKEAHRESYPSSTELNKLLDIFLKVCDAMNYAHDKAVVHLDLKPENIQVGSHGEVIVCDWGIAKLLGERSVNDHDFDNLLLNPDLINTMTLKGKIKGTPGYMAPEQAAGTDKTCQTDIYTLGAILYTILTGKVPVAGNTVEEILKNTIDGKVIEPEKRTLNNLSRSLCSIATKALSLKAEDRFESASHMQEDIRKFLAGHSPSAENSGFFNELKLLYIRNKLISNICLAFIFISSVAINHSINVLNKSKSREITIKAEIVKNAAPAHTKQALKYFRRGNSSAAMMEAKIAILLDPKDNKAHNLLGLLYFIKGQFPQANESFREPLDETSLSLRNLSVMYINGSYDLKEEDQYIKEILSANETPIDLYLYWLKHKNSTFQHYAIEHLQFPITNAERLLKFTAELNDQGLQQSLVNKVIDSLLFYKQWHKRRQAVELAISLTEDEGLKDKMTAILPANLAMGQKVKVVGKSITYPEDAVDGNKTLFSGWSTSTEYGSIEVDIGKVEEIRQLVIFFSQSHRKTVSYEYSVETSTDGINFSLLIDPTKHILPIAVEAIDRRKNDKNKAQVVHTFKKTKARFIRLSANSEDGVHISEFEVYR